MKKVFLMLAVAFSMTMFSCANKQAENTEATEEAPVVETVEEAVVAEPDSACCAMDSCCNEVVGVVEGAVEAVTE